MHAVSHVAPLQNPAYRITISTYMLIIKGGRFGIGIDIACIIG